MSQLKLKDLAAYAVTRIESGASKTELTNQLASILVDGRMTRETGMLMRLIESELNRRGITEVTIRSAYPVDASTKQALAAALGASKPVFYEEIDASVIGGVSARTLESELDLTIKTQLRAVIDNVKRGK